MTNNSLIISINELLKNKNFDYAFCGGYAIDLFLGQLTRRHGDVDVFAYWEDRDAVIKYMWSHGFEVYEMIGGGQAHKITDVNNQMKLKRNIIAVDNCEFVSLNHTDNINIFDVDFLPVQQSKPNFIEFLFNDKTDTDFLYARDHRVKLNLEKAVLYRNDIPYLAPEICLLYKSTDTERKGYQQDYDNAVKCMSAEQIMWLNEALKFVYPDGHKWIQRSV